MSRVSLLLLPCFQTQLLKLSCIVSFSHSAIAIGREDLENMDANSSTTPPRFTTEEMAGPPPPDELQIFHLVFLLLVCLLGTFGNIMTIIAVKIERKLRESLSNIFVINLAIADLIVCATVVPMLIAHDAHAETLFGPTLCYVTAAVSGVACHTAAATMTCIAVIRYVAASRATSYHDIVTRTRVYIGIAAVWLFAAINTAPILLAWIEVGYDVTKYVCVCFDGTFKLYYTLGPVFIGHFLPHAITIYCYFRIMMAMRKSRVRVLSTSGATSDTHNSVSGAGDKDKRKSTTIVNSDTETDTGKTTLSVSNWTKHEIQLLKTSIWIIAFFSFCWIPYGVLVLLQDLAPIELKKTFASFCLLSFSLNPMIYGLLSKAFRRAYLRIIRKIFCNFCSSKGQRSYSYTSRDSSNAVSMETQKSKVHQLQMDETRQYGRGSIDVDSRVV